MLLIKICSFKWQHCLLLCYINYPLLSNEQRARFLSLTLSLHEYLSHVIDLVVTRVFKWRRSYQKHLSARKMQLCPLPHSLHVPSTFAYVQPWSNWSIAAKTKNKLNYSKASCCEYIAWYIVVVKPQERHQWHCSGVFIVNCENISHYDLILGSHSKRSAVYFVLI